MPRDLLLFFAGLSALVAVGCGKNVGDACKTSVDCSQGGERLCDITQPGGYCTIFNCEPDRCPSEAACIVFDPNPSPNASCDEHNGLSRFARSFCLFKCSSNDDCRSGYVCQDFSPDNASNPWNAIAVDSSNDGKVCVAAHNTQSVPTDAFTGDNVCSGSTSSGGSSGSGGSANSSGGTSAGGAVNGGASGASGAGGGESDAGNNGG